MALDYDCRTRAGWLEQHLAALGEVQEAPALEGKWINSVEQPGFYARGFPYEYRNAEDSVVRERAASGTVKINMGVWDNVLDLNGVDKVQRDVAGKDVPREPGLRGEGNYVALGNIPVCGMNTAFSAEGGLISYSADFAQISRRAAVYVDKILKGAKASDLPIQRPTKFELVVNLKTAHALGIGIPQALLVRADRVVE